METLEGTQPNCKVRGRSSSHDHCHFWHHLQIQRAPQTTLWLDNLLGLTKGLQITGIQIKVSQGKKHLVWSPGKFYMLICQCPLPMESGHVLPAPVCDSMHDCQPGNLIQASVYRVFMGLHYVGIIDSSLCRLNCLCGWTQSPNGLILCNPEPCSKPYCWYLWHGQLLL